MRYELHETMRTSNLGKQPYATRILRLAYLAPGIVEGIVAGKQPRSLTLKRLLREIPLNWAEQRERFGITQT